MRTVLHICHLKKHLLESFPRMDYMLVLRLVTQEEDLIELLDQAVIDLKAESPLKIRANRLMLTDTLVSILQSIHAVHLEHTGVAAATVAAPEPQEALPEFITIPLLEG